MRRLATRAVCLCAALGAAAAQAQLSDADIAAREAIRGSFLSCAAAGVLSEQATVGEALRRRLALPPDASRDRIYDAICDLTAPNSPRVRKAGEEFVLEAGELELRMRYDTGAKHITFIEAARVPVAPKPPPAAQVEKPRPKPELVVEVEKPKPVVEVEKPKPVVEAEKPKPAPAAAKPAPPVSAIRLPPPVRRTGPCIVKPVMTDEELANCGASAD